MRPQHDIRSAQSAEGWLSRERLTALALLAATLVALYACYLLARPFLPALTWALALAVVGYPIHRWINNRIPRPGVAAVVTTAVLCLIIVLPAAWIGHQVGKQATETFATTKKEAEQGHWREMLERNPRVEPILSWIEQQIDFKEELDRVGKAVGERLPRFARGIIDFTIQLLITIFLLFYFFRDRDIVLRTVSSLVPLSKEESDAAVKRVKDTIRGTVFGHLLVALVQGVLGGLMFWWLDLPAPFLWGAVMAVLAVLPVLGAALVWVPAVLFLTLEGRLGDALILTAWGGIVISLIDNLLYPVLVGKELRMHTVPVFLSILGGLHLFGASGFVLGPVVLAVTLVLLDVWRWRTAAGRKADAK